MSDPPAVTLDQVITLARQLPPREKLRLIECLAREVEHDLRAELQTPRPRRSRLGLCADLGPAPSAAEIDEVRREMWASFPRDDI